MTPQHVISQLLASASKHLKNIDLLKKIIITAYLGRLQINGQSPDNSIPFANYLFDNEYTVFDFTHMSEKKRELFKQWLLEPHQKNKKKAYFTDLAVNEYRGFTAAVTINWFGKFMRWFRGLYNEHWKINDLDLSLHYQLLGIDMCPGQEGILIGFKQLLVPPTGIKYKALDDNQTEPMGNTKRVFITDQLVDHLLKLDVKTLNFETVCKSHHPLAIHVTDLEKRHQEMLNYRSMQKYIQLESWYVVLWNWIISWFIKKEHPKQKSVVSKESNKLTLLYEDETTNIYQRPNQEILVKEKRPIVENLVFCGGGAKIFAHIGVWKAIRETNIAPKRFAGTSAGAIMALMCYLGYSPEEITNLFKHFRQEHLIYLDIDIRGISEPNALKTALDYAIAAKVNQIVTKYKIPYPQGKITFATLEALRIKCPNCGLGEELVVTATNKRLRKTSYFSLTKTPQMEVSDAVKVSASIPLVLKGTIIDGDEYSDGGVLCNFPADAIPDDNSTLLESEHGTNMKTLAVQFDNGTERAAIDRGMDKVHRENFFFNWIYELLTGVDDPASAWEQDLMRLRKYAAQSIIVDVGGIFSANFTVDEKNQTTLINNGYTAAKEYLKARYAKKTGGLYKNKEIMHSTFSSLEELLAYCCYKGKKNWYHIVLDLIKKSSLPNKEHLIKQAEKLLYPLYFNASQEVSSNPSPPTFFGNQIIMQEFAEHNNREHEILLKLYPLFLKLTPQLLKNAKEHDLLERARHSFTATSLFSCVHYFAQVKGEIHIIFHIFCNLVKALEREYKRQLSDASKLQKIYEDLDLIYHVLYSGDNLFKPEYYSLWTLNQLQGNQVLKELRANSAFIIKLCDSLKGGKRTSPIRGKIKEPEEGAIMPACSL